MRITTLRTAALGIVLVAALAGCTSNATSAEAEAETTPLAEVTPEPAVTETCVEGNAVVVLDEDTPEVTFTEPCDSVNVVGSDGTVTLADVSHLVIEGQGVTVTAGAVGTVDFAGDGNTVSHTGAAPTVNENGTFDNTVTAR
jgi:ABC-type Fe3+-hydroxamate transport system substrate-binding protein